MKTLFYNILLILAIVACVGSAVLAVDSIAHGDFLSFARFGAVFIVILLIGGYFRKPLAFFAAITGSPLYSGAAEQNLLGHVKSFTQAYAATSALVLKGGAKEQHVCYAQLTGAMTINATLTALRQFDIIYFHFNTDGTQRIVTFGTGFISSGTLTIAASKDATAVGIYDGTNIKIFAREVQA
jgi:hypothetical protein